MPGRIRKSLLVCVFALSLTGCGGGGDGSIPTDEAGQLLALLAAVQNAVQDGDCELAQGNAQEFVDRVNNLPKDVDQEVTNELTKAAANLDDLAAEPSECTPTGTSDVQTTTEEETTTEPTSTIESTTESSTTESSTTTEEDTTTTEPPQEDQDTTPPTGQGQGQGPPSTGGGNGPASGGVTGGGNAG